MIALLGTLALALVVGKLARRLGPAVDLTLLLLVAALVGVELMSWSGGGAGGPGHWLRGLLISLTR
jgi:hypothetical protein